MSEVTSDIYMYVFCRSLKFVISRQLKISVIEFSSVEPSFRLLFPQKLYLNVAQYGTLFQGGLTQYRRIQNGSQSNFCRSEFQCIEDYFSYYFFSSREDANISPVDAPNILSDCIRLLWIKSIACTFYKGPQRFTTICKFF